MSSHGSTFPVQTGSFPATSYSIHLIAANIISYLHSSHPIWSQNHTKSPLCPEKGRFCSAIPKPILRLDHRTLLWQITSLYTVSMSPSRGLNCQWLSTLTLIVFTTFTTTCFRSSLFLLRICDRFLSVFRVNTFFAQL